MDLPVDNLYDKLIGCLIPAWEGGGDARQNCVRRERQVHAGVLKNN